MSRHSEVIGISSKATRDLLSEVVQDWLRESGVQVRFESVGGIEVPRHLRDGEAFDLVVVAAGALAGLAEEGLVFAETQRAFAVSPAALAVRSGAAAPRIDTTDDLVRALRNAESIGYSTGPSGEALLSLLDRVGLRPEVDTRLVRAAPGVAVAELIRAGQAEIGLQQLSELAGCDGVVVLGPLPAGAAIATTFAAAICQASRKRAHAQAFIDFLASPKAAGIIERAHMKPPGDDIPGAGDRS